MTRDERMEWWRRRLTRVAIEVGIINLLAWGVLCLRWGWPS